MFKLTTTMIKKIAFISSILFLTISLQSFAQSNFELKNISKNYNVNISVEKCEDDICSGIGNIKLYSKFNKKFFQELKSDDLFFSLDKNKNPSNHVELYDEQTPLIFDDFNFDSTEDIAVRNGNNSGYGGASYDVYVFNITSKKFVLSKELTELASTNLGMFQIDKKKKRIITFTKSGCCWHLTTEYEVIPKKGLVKVYEREEDATKNDNFIHITERFLVKGKWKIITKKENL